MNPRSKKYVESRKAAKNNTKSAVAVAENIPLKKSIKKSKEDTALPAEKSKPKLKEASATQDDTGGGNDSGKRSDEN